MYHENHLPVNQSCGTVLLQEWLVICYNEPDRLDPRSPETCHERSSPI
jgi:hypothetical protein